MFLRDKLNTDKLNWHWNSKSHIKVTKINKMKEHGFKSSAPFGVATKRFAKLGFHPELDKSGAMKREITKLGPGSFDPRGPQCPAKRGMKWAPDKPQAWPCFTAMGVPVGAPNWKLRSSPSFWGSETPTCWTRGSLSAQWEAQEVRTSTTSCFKRWRAYARRMWGLEVGDDLPRHSLAKRLRPQVGWSNSRPPTEISFWLKIFLSGDPRAWEYRGFLDTYMKGVAGSYQQSKKTFSTLPTFEYDGFADRFKSGAKPYHLPPNLYELHDMKNTSDIIRRIVSLK